MKKSIQNKLDELKGNLVALLPSNKLKAAILATMALALAACDNGSGGSDNPYVPPYEEESPNPPEPEDPTKDVASRTLNSISATHNGTSAKSLNDILNNTTFTINYDIIYTDDTADNKTATVDKSKLDELFKGVVSFSVNGDFSETNQTVDLIITYNDKQFTLSGIKNGNYKSQETQQPQPSIKDVTALLKEILTEAEYNRISEELSSKNITLTAQTIKAVGDHFPSLEKDAESGKEAKDVENADVILQNKEAFVAQAEGKINITKSGKYALNSYNISVIFNDVFNLDEISLPANNGKGDFSNSTLTNGGSKILIDKLNEIRGSSLPTLLFEKTNNISGDSSEKDTYDLYKAYSKELGKLQLKGNLYLSIIDGKKISGDSNYTLFENGGNTAKDADNKSIKSLNIDALVQMTKQLNIYSFYNMIISGNATATATVNWELMNIVFEGDMSRIKNNFRNPNGGGSLYLYGIIYFKDKPYSNNGNEPNGQSVRGMLKLNNLQGVSSENFQIGFSSTTYSVLDVSGVDKNSLDKYTPKDKEIIIDGGHTHAIYFSEDFIGLKDNQTKINELCGKFFPKGAAGIVNAYLGDKKVKGNDFNAPNGYFSAASRTPRTLKEFEDFGNNLIEKDEIKFKESAKSSYDGYTTDWDNLEQRERENLTEDEEKGNNLLAKNDRRIEFIDPETEKIIFSVVNDRQYNA